MYRLAPVVDPAERTDPRPQDLVLTLLGAHLEPRAGGEVWSGGLVELLAEFGFSAGAARVALTRLVGRDLLARIRRGRLVSYTLTPRGLAVLAEGDRRIFRLGQPGGDDRWTVLWHAIPEDRRTARERLVRRLRFLGFGPAADGTWIAAHDREAEVVALLADLDVRQHAGLLLGAPARSLDFAAFAARVWNLTELAARYRDFVAEFDVPHPRTDRDSFLLRTRLVHAFRQFPFLDPELPADLVPGPEHRAHAVRLFHDHYAALAPAARRHFTRVTAP